jgi:hypothetical protein
LAAPISEQTPLDEILLGVLTLGTSDVESIDMKNVALKNPFNSPLRSMQVRLSQNMRKPIRMEEENKYPLTLQSNLKYLIPCLSLMS